MRFEDECNRRPWDPRAFLSSESGRSPADEIRPTQVEMMELGVSAIRNYAARFARNPLCEFHFSEA